VLINHLKKRLKKFELVSIHEMFLALSTFQGVHVDDPVEKIIAHLHISIYDFARPVVNHQASIQSPINRAKRMPAPFMAGRAGSGKLLESR
jgi:hypothetical protein